MSLILFSLPNGAEIVGKLTADDMLSFTVEQPLAIRPVEKAPGQYMLDLFPHSLVNPEGTHKFTRAQVLSISQSNVPEMLEKAYLERTSSIVLAGAVDAFANLK